jgi:hypothetical protein
VDGSLASIEIRQLRRVTKTTNRCNFTTVKQ